MSWRNFQDSTPNDKIDKIDKMALPESCTPHIVDKVDIVYRGEDQKKQEETPDPFLAGHHVLVHLPEVGGIWLASDEQAAGSLDAGGFPVLYERDVRWIMQAEGHEARLDRLKVILGKRHPLTATVLEIFQGATVTRVYQSMRSARR